jgi:protein-tyrosine kinase
MGIIEQATRRLEELRRAEVEVGREAPLPAQLVGPPQGSVTHRGGSERDSIVEPLHSFTHDAAISESAAAVIQEAHAKAPLIGRDRSASALTDGAGSGDACAELVVASHPFGTQADAFRELRSQIMMGIMGAEEPRRPLAVVSPDSGDGKTFIAANLAAAFSQLGGRTLLVDANMRAPRQHQLFKIGIHPGLSGILAGSSASDVIQQVLELPNLYVMPVGTVPPNPLELVQRPALGLLLRELLGKFHYVIVDTPAVRRGADARAVAMHCGAALVVGRRGKTPMKTISSLSDAFAKAKVRLAGVVMNDR